MRATFEKFCDNYKEELREGKERVRLECIGGPQLGQVLDFEYKVTPYELVYKIGRNYLGNEH